MQFSANEVRTTVKFRQPSATIFYPFLRLPMDNRWMRLITYRRDATIGPALLKDGHVFPLTPLGYPDTLSFIAAGPKSMGCGQSLSWKRPV